MMRLSIITVSFNSDKTIQNTFDSIRAQKIIGFDLEYIHVDGASTDSTMSISIDNDDIICKRVSEKDSGIYNAMNKGLKMATGEVVGFLNSDDIYASPNILSKIMGLFRDNNKLDIVYSDIDYVDFNGKIIRKWRSGDQKKFSTGWHPAHPGFFAKKRLFEDHGGFDEALSIAADFDLMLRFLDVANGNAIYLDEVAVKMQIGGVSNRDLKNVLISNRQILDSFDKYAIRPQFFYTLRRWFKKSIQKL